MLSSFRTKLVAAAAALLASTALAEVPSRIDVAGEPTPVWVSEEAARHGADLRWELFAPPFAALLQDGLEVAQKASEPCASVQLVGLHPPPKLNLADLARDSKFVLEGRITDVKQGFFNGSPTLMYELELSVDHREPTELARQRVYFLGPGAAIEIGSATLCTRGPRYPERPAVGQRVIVMSDQELVASPLVLLTRDYSLVWQREDGSGSSSPSLQLPQQPFVELSLEIGGALKADAR